MKSLGKRQPHLPQPRLRRPPSSTIFPRREEKSGTGAASASWLQALCCLVPRAPCRLLPLPALCAATHTLPCVCALPLLVCLPCCLAYCCLLLIAVPPYIYVPSLYVPLYANNLAATLAALCHLLITYCNPPNICSRARAPSCVCAR